MYRQAKPCATSFFMRNILNIIGAIVAPTMPDKITAKTVMGIIPPNSSAMPIAIGAVIDLGSKDTANSFDILNNLSKIVITIALAKQPANMLDITATIFFFRILSCLYNGTAKHTIVGVRKYGIYFAPLL